MRGKQLSGSLLVHFIYKLISANRFTVCNEPKGFFLHTFMLLFLSSSISGRMLKDQKTWKLVVSGGIFVHRTGHGDGG